jgi:hypothetical protein
MEKTGASPSKISASRFELKNFSAGNLISWTGFSIALQAMA